MSADQPLSLVRRGRDPEEEEYVRPLDWGIIRRLFAYTKPHARRRNLLIVLTLFRAGQLPALVWLASEIIGGPIAGHEFSLMGYALGAYLLLALSTDVMFHFRLRYAFELGESVVHTLRLQIFDHVQRMPMSFFHRMKLGSIIGRMTSDVDSLRVGIQDVFFVGIVQVGAMFFAAAIMAFTDWVLFLVVLGLAPILWTINHHFRMRLSRDSRAAQESFSRVTATLAESVNGVRVIQGFVRQETNTGLFRNLLADHSRYNIAMARSSALLLPVLELNSQFFVATLLVLGGWRVFQGEADIGVLIKFFLVANQFFAPLQILGNLYNQALVAMAGAERVFQLLDTKPEWEDAPEASDLVDPRRVTSDMGRVTRVEAAKNRPDGVVGPPGGDAEAPIVSPGPFGAGMHVEFRRVTFGYDPKRPVLHDVSFEARPGQTVALVGHTGSGKSSIVSLAAKFYLPSAGELFLDGREIRTLTSRSLHRQTGLVLQQNFLFGGTVRENIRLSRPESTDEEVRAAVARLDCIDILDALPEGLDTEVGERGGSLSSGQRQLVCFARAMLADPRLVILDEATSAIDALTEARLQNALRLLLAGRTSFVVAHRLSTIRHADLVLVLDQGRIIERGTHTELLSWKSHYAALYRQFVRVDERG